VGTPLLCFFNLRTRLWQLCAFRTELRFASLVRQARPSNTNHTPSTRNALLNLNLLPAPQRGLFPSSNTFDPSRWLADPITGRPPLGPDGKKIADEVPESVF